MKKLAYMFSALAFVLSIAMVGCTPAEEGEAAETTEEAAPAE